MKTAKRAVGFEKFIPELRGERASSFEALDPVKDQIEAKFGLFSVVNQSFARNSNQQMPTP